MNKIIKTIVVFITAFILSSSPAFANSKAEQIEQYCKIQQETAYIIMAHRQTGTPREVLYSLIDDGQPGANTTKRIISAAFTIEQYDTQDKQYAVSVAFANEIHMLCMQAHDRVF